MNISMGLCQADDILLTEWNASILGPNGTPHQERLYELRVTCGPEYPDRPPEVRFVTKINLACVDQRTGEVGRELPAFARWTRSNTIETVLLEIRQSMSTAANRRLAQPPEGSYF
jgi:ubiquitin-conjugating enzyme E2 variant